MLRTSAVPAMGELNVTAIVIFIRLRRCKPDGHLVGRKPHSIGRRFLYRWRIHYGNAKRPWHWRATSCRAATFLGLTGLVFIGGADAMLFTTGIAVGWAVILFVFSDRLRNLGRYYLCRCGRLPFAIKSTSHSCRSWNTHRRHPVPHSSDGRCRLADRDPFRPAVLGCSGNRWHLE